MVVFGFALVTNDVCSQGLISQSADSNGNYLRVGPRGNLFNPNPLMLNLGHNSISTEGGLFGFLRKPTLKLNPESGNVTIGATQSDVAGLSIRAFNEAAGGVDLRLEGEGRVGIQSSMFIQLDDDNNENAYFLIRDGENKNIFTVGETGQSYLKGDITITGDIKLNGRITGNEEMEIISGASFQGAYDSEVAILRSDTWVINGHAHLRANLNLPNNAKITKIDILYLDNSPDDIDVEISSIANLSNSFHTDHFQWDSSNSSSNIRQATIDNLNFTIDNLNRVYFVKLYSRDWGRDAVKFRAIKIYYTR